MSALKPPRVLVIRLSSLGDVVLTAPVFRALRQAWPEAHLAVLVKEKYVDVLAENSDVDERLVLRPGESLLSVIRRVRNGRYQIVVDLHSNIRSWIIGFFSGAAQCVRYRKSILARRLFVRWRVPSSELRQHTLDRYLKALKPLGISVEEPQPSAPAPKILLIQTAFLGDAVLTTPLLSALQDHYPASPVTVVCTPEVSEIFQRHPAVARVVVYDKRGAKGKAERLGSLARQLRQEHFDLAFIPHRSFRSALLAWRARVPRRIGFSSSQGRWFLTDVVPFQWGVHDADRNLALLNAVGIRPSAGALSIQPEQAAQRAIERKLEQEGIAATDPILGVNVGSVWATKRWLPEGFAAVADRVIRELGVPVVFFGSAADRPVVAEVLKAMREKALDWVGETPLRELIAAIARCQAFLTNDSGPMHIAVAAQVPTVALFGPTTRELGFFPYGEGHIVIEKELPCRPCGLHGAKRCPLEHFQCMKTITSAEVFEAVRMQLEKGVKAALTPTLSHLRWARESEEFPLPSKMGEG